MQNGSSQGYLTRAWNGDIKLWQSVCLSFTGIICAFIIAFLLGAAILTLKTNGYIHFNIIPLNNLITISLVILFNVFTIRSVWLCASSPKLKVRQGRYRDVAS
ncbi:MAG: hypothetical protein V5789_13220 [Colwellia sp.]